MSISSWKGEKFAHSTHLNVPIFGWVGDGIVEAMNGMWKRYTVYISIFILLSIIFWFANIAVIRKIEP